MIKTFEVKNKFVLSKLNFIESKLLNINHDNIRIIQYECLGRKKDRLSENYLKEIMLRRDDHQGNPDYQPRYYNFKYGSEVIDDEIYKHKCDLTEYMFCQRICLDVFYPPKSYCDWHSNANASGYGIMFTWSETGEGDFRYWDNDKKEVIIIPDKKGWNAKQFYFGAYEEPEKLVYHASSNDCLRYSMAFNFLDEKEVWEDTIEMLKNYE